MTVQRCAVNDGNFGILDAILGAFAPPETVDFSDKSNIFEPTETRVRAQSVTQDLRLPVQPRPRSPKLGFSTYTRYAAVTHHHRQNLGLKLNTRI